MSEPWAEAVERGKEEPVTPIEAAVRSELENLWADLDRAQREALNGQWSSGCDWYAERIVKLTRAVGAAPWGQVQCSLLLNGTYQGIMKAGGFEYPEPNMDEVRALDAQIKAGAVRIR